MDSIERVEGRLADAAHAASSSEWAPPSREQLDFLDARQRALDGLRSREPQTEEEWRDANVTVWGPVDPEDGMWFVRSFQYVQEREGAPFHPALAEYRWSGERKDKPVLIEMLVRTDTTIVHKAGGVSTNVGAAGADWMIDGLRDMWETLEVVPDFGTVDNQPLPRLR